MAEVQDVTGDIEVTGDGDPTPTIDMSGALENAPGLKTVQSGIDTVTGIWQGLPDDPDAGEIATHAAGVASDAAGFVAECATEAATAVLDPVGWLVENGLDMVLHLVTPLQDALHQVTGDGPRLTTAGEDFTAIGEGLVSYSEEFARVADEALKDWQGEAADAARKSLATFTQGIQGVATSAGGVAEVLKTSAMVMQIIEEVIKAIITELVSALIMIWLPALAASIVSLGSSVAAAMSASVTKAAAAFSRVTAKMGKLGKLLDKILEFFKKFGSGMVKLGKKLGAGEGGRFVDEFGQEAAAMSRRVAEIGRKAATKGAVKDALGAGLDTAATQVSETYLGVDVTDLKVDNEWQAAELANNVYSKGLEHAEGDLGSGASAEETEEQLKM